MATGQKPTSAGRPFALDGGRAWYCLGLLTFAYALAYVDRQLLNLLVDPIKKTLSISDTQFSFVQGTAFVAAYLVAAPLFGRLVDMTSRKLVLIAGVVIWSLSTALCGLATSYESLFLARIGVGLSEACIFPVAISAVADSFSTDRIARAMSVFTLGVQIGGGFSLIAGGLVVAFAGALTKSIPILGQFEKWQAAFIVVGVPGILFGLLLLTMPEPPRGRGGTEVVSRKPMAWTSILYQLNFQRDFYVRYFLIVGTIAIVQLGMPTWFPSVLIRTFGMPMAETGLKLGVISVTFSTIGNLLGPTVSRVLAARGHADALLRTAAFSMVGLSISCGMLSLSSSANMALACAAGMVFFTGMPIGVMAAAMQNITENQMRGIAGSLQTFSAQILGYMIGPTLIALLTDHVFHDPTKVIYSFMIVTVFASLLSGYLLFSILVPYRAIISPDSSGYDHKKMIIDSL